MPMKPREMINLLNAKGFRLVGTNGSHQKFKNPSTGKVVIVPVHAKDLKKVQRKIF